ncbi:helix-turn-helix domain-containing protein [Velocimicrobium porci]|uniref:Helix-turn-helix transcriptional regulator n=1 Tax=Velocimicrobium porci TaxID=2606634 RepID=A0A6L5Y186_9FIRM|nr:helix-turn-helix transcriptional regulator [Velocimicrobium porci]MSS64916.1 helix-turn-helix transcriptional regulator [Velocimicrobium porci]
MDYTILGQKIRKERLRLHLTQEKLAEEVCLSPAYIGQIERGERGLTIENLVLLANRFTVTVDYLLSDSLVVSDESNLSLWLQLMDGRSAKERNLAVNLVNALFLSLDKEKPIE